MFRGHETILHKYAISGNLSANWAMLLHKYKYKHARSKCWWKWNVLVWVFVDSQATNNYNNTGNAHMNPPTFLDRVQSVKEISRQAMQALEWYDKEPYLHIYANPPKFTFVSIKLNVAVFVCKKCNFDRH